MLRAAEEEGLRKGKAMRSIGTLHPTESIPVPPDAVQTLLVAGSSGQALDWPAGSSAGLIVRWTGFSTAGAVLNFGVNPFSTMAQAPSTSTASSTQGSTAFQVPIMGQGAFQIPGSSTGWSAAALSSGYIMAEMWKKGG